MARLPEEMIYELKDVERLRELTQRLVYHYNSIEKITKMMSELDVRATLSVKNKDNDKYNNEGV